ncbi:peptidoglycan editing factor PgeF [Oceanivirga miroungae]|uniref:Purine nucleoside phosphorylase n=1 Tax=Oceanivirga miroungae TaxID=1130046 RepID=A0A6I8MAI8_9FUSO|nr:peptidoglycan editing factor PgeF [Oceanivirga miroungae]VWL85328.1 Laccase domain protein YfiH [Oceanivirga miroungae]
MYIEFEKLKEYGFTAIQTTKDEKDMKDEKNLEKIINKLNIDRKYLVKGVQTHSTNILCVDKNTDISDIKDYDGYITNDKNMTLLAYFADCMPMFLIDKNKKTFSLLHGGWRGSSNKILEKAINIMVEKYDANKNDILVVLGICISSKNYEISKDLADELLKNLKFDKIIERNNEKYYLNLAMLNKNIAISNGILEENIILNNYCTFDGNFFSYRKDKTTSRMAAIIKVGE